MKDYEGTWVLSKRKYYIFTWYFGRYKKTIVQSENCLQELEIQAIFCKFSGFCKRVVSIPIYCTFNFYFSSICTKEEPSTGNPMNFTPEDENEFIKEAVSQKLNIPLVNPSHKVWRDSTKSKARNSPFHIGDFIRYTNEGQNDMVELVDVNTNDTYPIK